MPLTRNAREMAMLYSNRLKPLRYMKTKVKISSTAIAWITSFLLLILMFITYFLFQEPPYEA